jgi:hypothetical protein
MRGALAKDDLAGNVNVSSRQSGFGVQMFAQSIYNFVPTVSMQCDTVVSGTRQ